MITHTWKNAGEGLFPNRSAGWDGKYGVTFALLHPSTGTPILRIETDAEPGNWLKDNPQTTTTPFTLNETPAGTWKLGVAIVDRTDGDTSDIALAIREERLPNGWYVLGDVDVAD